MFLISGEGRTDFGIENSERRGPMRILLNVLSGKDLDCKLIPRADLSLERKRQNKRSPLLRGVKKSPGRIWYDEARALVGLRPVDVSSCGFILFRDRDENSIGLMRSAIKLGFKDSGQEKCGVAMIPCPTSEAWLLAYFQETPYENCSRFESLAGVKSDPKSPSSVLATYLNCPISEIYKTISANGYRGYDVIKAIDWNRVNMPSFNQFKTDFLTVVKRLDELSGAGA